MSFPGFHSLWEKFKCKAESGTFRLHSCGVIFLFSIFFARRWLLFLSFFLPSDRCESDWLTIDRPKGRSERRKLDRCFLSLPFALRWLFVGRKARSLDSLEQTKRLSLFIAQMVRLLLNARVDSLLHNEKNILALFFSSSSSRDD